jgi:hypothetical protein
MPIPIHQDEARLLVDRLRWIYNQRRIDLDLAGEVCNKHLQPIIHWLDEYVALRDKVSETQG